MSGMIPGNNSKSTTSASPSPLLNAFFLPVIKVFSHSGENVEKNENLSPLLL
jgi:hypothetical protein